MLRLSVGYQDSDKFLFSEIVKTYKSAVEEVYFAWIGKKAAAPRSADMTDILTILCKSGSWRN